MDIRQAFQFLNDLFRTGFQIYIHLYFVIPTAATQYADEKEIKEMDTKRTHTSLKPK